MLAPATNVGGDSFDCALNGDTLHGMGHGLQAALLAAVAVGAPQRPPRRPGPGGDGPGDRQQPRRTIRARYVRHRHHR